MTKRRVISCLNIVFEQIRNNNYYRYNKTYERESEIFDLSSAGYVCMRAWFASPTREEASQGDPPFCRWYTRRDINSTLHRYTIFVCMCVCALQQGPPR